MVLQNGFTAPLFFSREDSVFNRIPMEILPQLTGANSLYFEADGAYEFDTFFRYNGPTAAGSLNGYTLSGTGTPTVSFASSSDTAFIRLIANTGAVGNSAQLELDPFGVRVQSNRIVWLTTRMSVRQSATTAAFFGLGTANTSDVFTALPDDGYFFFKPAAATQWEFHVRSGGVSTIVNAFPNVTIDNANRAFGLSSVQRAMSMFHSSDRSTFVPNPRVTNDDPNIPSDASVLNLYFAVQRSVSTGDAFSDIDYFFYGSQDFDD